MNKKSSQVAIAVRAIIQNSRGEILLLKRASKDRYGDLWCLPGGKVEFGQTVKEAIEREVWEETALKCRLTEFLFYHEGLPQKGIKDHYLNLIFSCQTSGSIVLNEESSDYAWLGEDQLGRLPMAFNHNDVIMKYWREFL